ncbi:SAM-dependent methyltransferase [Streptomyces sp. NPDC048172]|uniref:SAM-dependent methyltransferase n=1 Tax=Streptomyces sp. NPDC048172 TaxID=3365505 RepID=UPI00371536EF
MSQQTPEEPPIGPVGPAPARMYDYFLGGKSNYTVDREAAAKVLSVFPSALTAARENREFMHRGVRHLARDHGIRQFLDIGTGIPTEPNLHQIAQGVHPGARVVYVDHDPVVLAHDRALMASAPEGATAYIEADVREPERILQHAGKTLDMERPVAVTLVALLHFVRAQDDPEGIVRTLMADLPSGSALAISQGSADLDPRLHEVQAIYAERGIALELRDRERTEALFAAGGVELLAPGLTVSYEWHPEFIGEGEYPRPANSMTPAESGVWVGVGLKP